MFSNFLTEAIVHHNELPIPAVYYGVIALIAFAVLGFVTWSYRDVANRHEHKTGNQQAHH